MSAWRGMRRPVVSRIASLVCPRSQPRTRAGFSPSTQFSTTARLEISPGLSSTAARTAGRYPLEDCTRSRCVHSNIQEEHALVQMQILGREPPLSLADRREFQHDHIDAIFPMATVGLENVLRQTVTGAINRYARCVFDRKVKGHGPTVDE
jgi:hypothetical protein